MPVYDPEKHHRRSIRLRGYDYRLPGAYFVTICSYRWRCLFGEVIEGQMVPNAYGTVVHDEWCQSAKIRQEIRLDEFVVMPNHVHGIVVIIDDVGATGWSPVGGATGRSPLHVRPGPPPRSLGSFIAGFKSATTHRINGIRDTPGTPVWQRNYYEHIIRTEDECDEVRTYIQENPLRWDLDENHPRRRRAG
jgi:REP element-mobilizing transposase RayT